MACTLVRPMRHTVLGEQYWIHNIMANFETVHISVHMASQALGAHKGKERVMAFHVMLTYCIVPPCGCLCVRHAVSYTHMNHMSDSNMERRMVECEKKEDDMVAQPPRKKRQTRQWSKKEVNTICKELLYITQGW